MISRPTNENPDCLGLIGPLPALDPLSQLLDGLPIVCWVNHDMSLTSPWGLTIEARHAAFYVVLQGSCWLELEGQAQPTRLSTGDLVILPRPITHALYDRSDSHRRRVPQSSADGASSERPTNTGPGIRLACGCFKFDERGRHPLLSFLPSQLYFSAAGQPQTTWWRPLLEAMADEARVEQLGTQSIIHRLGQILLVRAVRASLPELSDTRLRALLDSTIGPAIGLIHSRPEAPWTVASLARSVGLSRSALAAHFTATVGQPPLRYLAEYRMQRAATLLRSGRCGLKEIAAKVGYESVAAFSNAFKRWSGLAPGAFRRRNRILAVDDSRLAAAGL